MLKRIVLFSFVVVSAGVLSAQEATSPANPNTDMPSVAQRYAAAEVAESPDFQKHVVPLLGKLGCNGRPVTVRFRDAVDSD